MCNSSKTVQAKLIYIVTGLVIRSYVQSEGINTFGSIGTLKNRWTILDFYEWKAASDKLMYMFKRHVTIKMYKTSVHMRLK